MQHPVPPPLLARRSVYFNYFNCDHVTVCNCDCDCEVGKVTEIVLNVAT